MFRTLKYLCSTLLLLLCGPVYMAALGSDAEGLSRQSWRTAPRNSSGQAPLPAEHSDAVIQVYAARTYSWRGHLAVHTWISTKEKDADHYQVHQVIGFREGRGLPVVSSAPDIPDRYWYGNRPELLVDVRGKTAGNLIPKVINAVHNYPYPGEYTMWPGPNSNTFTAYVGRSVPELRLSLPVTAIGKDYLPGGALLASTPSGTGYQVSIFGTVGVMAAIEEGLEINFLGLVAGMDFRRPALKIPGIGRIGTDTD